MAQLYTVAETPPAAPLSSVERLVEVVQELSLARSLDEVMAVVRLAARELTGADGATFVLKDGDKCYYAEENAISPLWKGQRFPLKSCISGWVMINREPAVIEDIYVDPRVPHDAYRPTFVKSLVMVPIRKEQPIGAIGNYWAERRQPGVEQLALLQALANVTSVAIENVNLYLELQKKIALLEKSNEDLDRFAWIASHDLKSPLRAIDNLSRWVEEDAGTALPPKQAEYLTTMRRRVQRMERLLDDLLDYARLTHRVGPEDDTVDGLELMQGVGDLIEVPQGFHFKVSPAFKGLTLPRMPLERVLANLASNAFKHHDRKTGTVEVTVEDFGPHYVFTVTDDGPGIPPQFHARIFEMFQTLKPRDQTEGSGMGLAIVKKLLEGHGSKITVASAGARGAVFSFDWKKPLPVVPSHP